MFCKNIVNSDLFFNSKKIIRFLVGTELIDNAAFLKK